MLKYVDVHCHVNEFPNYENFLKKNKDILIINNGLNSESNRKSLELCKKYSNVKVALGIHPLDVEGTNVRKEIDFIRRNKNKIVAIGEIGLDKKYSTYLNEQIKAFSSFLELSLDLKLPVIVHSRLAEHETINLLEDNDVKKVVMHCFSGNLKLVKRIIDNNWMLSISSLVENSEQFKKIVLYSDINNLLTESDTPYLGVSKDIGPLVVKNVVKKISELKKINEEEIRKKILKNYEKIFVENFKK